MDDKSFNIRVPKRWVRVAMIVGVTALIVAPLTAIASHSFTDVPDTNTFHSDIEWMKDSGVTKGCNPPANTEYCPDDNVTRGQMAAFMNRFAGYIGATDGTPAQADNATTADSATNADDANTLDGDPKSSFQQWGDTLPPGDTLSGAYAIGGDNGFPGNGITFSVPLPGDIPATDAEFISVADSFTTDCPGPGEAAPGHFCAYESDRSSASIVFQCFCDPETAGEGIRSYGTSLFMSVTDPAEWSFGSWAVTSVTGLGTLSEATSSGTSDSPGS